MLCNNCSNKDIDITYIGLEMMIKLPMLQSSLLIVVYKVPLYVTCAIVQFDENLYSSLRNVTNLDVWLWPPSSQGTLKVTAKYIHVDKVKLHGRQGACEDCAVWSHQPPPIEILIWRRLS